MLNQRLVTYLQASLDVLNASLLNPMQSYVGLMACQYCLPMSGNNGNSAYIQCLFKNIMHSVRKFNVCIACANHV